MKPRILHVAAVDFTVAKLLAPQLDALVAEGYDVRVACQRTDPVHWAEIERFRPIDIPFPRALKPFGMLRAAGALSREIESWLPHVLHLHTPAASLPIRAVPHPSWPSTIKTVYTVHGYLHGWPPSGLREKLIQKLEKWESRRTDAMLFQSAEDFEMSKRLKYRGKLVMLGNGVENFWFDIQSKERRDTFELLFVGRIVREKGILDLLDAIEQVPSVHLHVVGDALGSDRDPVAAEVDSRLARPGMTNRVARHGMITRAQLRELYDRIDGVCLPSYREGVPRSLIEALASGRPVVATNIRGCRELVKDEVNGFLAPAGDVEALATALRRMVGLSAEALAAMGNEARASADPERRESSVFVRIIQAYTDLGVPPGDEA